MSAELAAGWDLPFRSVSGIQIDVHEPVQRTMPFASCAGEYSAIPFASTRTVPTPSTFFVDTVAPPDDWEPEAELEPELPPQALRANAAAIPSAASPEYVVSLFMPPCTSKDDLGIARTVNDVLSVVSRGRTVGQ